MRILHVSTYDAAGGAEAIADVLNRGLKRHGHTSEVIVGRFRNHWGGKAFRHHDYDRAWPRLVAKITAPLLSARLRGVGLRALHRVLNGLLAKPYSLLDIMRGRENMDFPGTMGELQQLLPDFDLVHCHNLHGNYFDLRVMPWLTTRMPVVQTFHDAWLLSGHCAHSLGCQRWKVGCGSCPDLTIPPRIFADGTAYNWKRKSDIYARSKIYAVCPSKWMQGILRESLVNPSVQLSKVIYNGVDPTRFSPGDQAKSRKSLGTPPEKLVIGFTSTAIHDTHWKAGPAFREALAILAASEIRSQLLLSTVGGRKSGFGELCGLATFEAGRLRPDEMAEWYRSLDVFVHPARAETFGLVCAEAGACGIPVIATPAGGLPEVIKHGETGILSSLDPVRLAEHIRQILMNPRKRVELGERARYHISTRFTEERMLAEYEQLYATAIESFTKSVPA